MEILPNASGSPVGASCSLTGAELRRRLADWRNLRDRALEVDRVEEGVRLHLRPDEPMDAVARLVALESDCCAFYRFTIGIEGTTRILTIEAGPGNAQAVHALVGLHS